MNAYDMTTIYAYSCGFDDAGEQLLHNTHTNCMYRSGHIGVCQPTWMHNIIIRQYKLISGSLVLDAVISLLLFNLSQCYLTCHVTQTESTLSYTNLQNPNRFSMVNRQESHC